MLEDEGTLSAVREYIASTQQPGYNLTAQDLANAVEAYWKRIAAEDPDLDTKENEVAVEEVKRTILALQNLDENEEKWTLTSRLAVNWLHRLGYRWKDIKKGLYKDGHEREDVLEYRQKIFLPQLEELKPQLLEWDEKGELVRTPAEIWATTGQCPVVLITHDECIFHANDGPTHVWTYDDSMPLRKKGFGQGIMISEFVSFKSRVCAPPSISDEELAQKGLSRYATESLEFGGNTWWTGDKLKAQALNKTIPLVELQFPGCQALFLFDNARNHDCFAPDALRANLMNLGSGGEGPPAHIRNGWFYDQEGNKWSQLMNWPEHPSTPCELWNKPKGLKVILQERGLWHDGLRLKCKNECNTTKPGGCCAQMLMSLQEDFKEQKSILQKAVESRGHLSLLYPKFHCELNWIEHFWGAAKYYTRKNCKYSIQDLRMKIPLDIKYAEKYLEMSWKRSNKIAEAYRNGIGWAAAEKRYKSHRHITTRRVFGQSVI